MPFLCVFVMSPNKLSKINALLFFFSTPNISDVDFKTSDEKNVRIA